MRQSLVFEPADKTNCAFPQGKSGTTARDEVASYFAIAPTRLRSIATSFSAFQNRKLGFFSPH